MKNIIKKYKLLGGIFIVTLVALFYVNQQVLIYQMGLRVKENRKIYSKLIDRNRILVYNILDLKSPVNLERKLLAKKLELDVPRKWQVVKLEHSPEKVVRKDVVRKGLFANLFIVGREAEASPNVNSFASINY